MSSLKTATSLKALASFIGAQQIGCGSAEDLQLNSVSTDTRNIQQGDLFVALKGENFDAHDFAEKAISLGASALVVDRPLALNVPQLLVKNTRLALGRIGEYNRALFSGCLFAVTGSSGKTTVKEMLAEILSGVGKVLATRGNLNNEIGVPLTLLEIEPDADYAVIEMGASGAGEISYLTKLAHPDIALVNNAMAAHLEGFGSLQGVVEAKAEIYAGLKPEGVGVVNLDDANAPYWLECLTDKRVMTFAVQAEVADVKALDLYQQSSGCYGFKLIAKEQAADITLNVLGAHNVSNALAAATMAFAAGISIDDIAAGLARFSPVQGRMNPLQGIAGSCVIDDSYNANPGSVKAAIQMLSELQGQRILVLGDMKELGNNAEDLHRELGVYAAEHSLDYLLTLGELSKAATEGYHKSCGDSALKAQHSTSEEQLLDYLTPLLEPTTTVLVKGSRSSGMDAIVNKLVKEV